MRDIHSVDIGEWANMDPGSTFRGTLEKAADFRSFSAIQGIASLEPSGNMTLVFVRAEPGVIHQTYTYRGGGVADGSLAMEVGDIAMSPTQVQACHVNIGAPEAAQFAAQMLAMLKRNAPDLYQQVALQSGLIPDQTPG